MTEHTPTREQVLDWLSNERQWGDVHRQPYYKWIAAELRAPQVPPDMVMVPRKPTTEMLDAAMGNIMRDPLVIQGCHGQLTEEWGAMIAAAEGKTR